MFMVFQNHLFDILGAGYSGVRSVSVKAWVIVSAILGGTIGGSVIVWIIVGGTDCLASIVGGTPSTVYDYNSLIIDLSNPGDTVEQLGRPRGRRSEVWPSVKVDVCNIAVNDERIVVYEFRDAQVVETEAGYVSPDGYRYQVPIESDMYAGVIHEWVAPPHFFKKGRVIVRYVGSDVSLVKELRRILGTEFAGAIR